MKGIYKRTIYPLAGALVILALLSVDLVSAATVPILTLIDNTSTVNINVTGADKNATVTFYYPNTASTNSIGISYTSIDLGQTDSAGSFSLPVSPSSYGLSNGVMVYVSVDGANSDQKAWPSDISVQSSVLSLSKQNATLSVGQSVNVFADNTVNILTVQGNSNPSIASAAIQSDSNSALITGLNVGSTNISICASTAGCGTVSVLVRAPTQTVSFSQASAYLVTGQSETLNVYGPDSNYALTNSKNDIVSANISGTNLILQGLNIGQSTVSVCANGWICGSMVVNVVSPGTNIPTQTTMSAPRYSGFNQPPQLSSMTVSSNDVLGLFFGAGSTISINFSTDETVTNVQTKIAGVQTAVTSNNDTYYVSYKATGNEILPLPVTISFTNLNGVAGQDNFSIGNSTQPISDTAAAQSAAQTSASYLFNRYLYSGMTDYGVSDPDVVALQNRLKDDGIYSGPITGYFGSQTKAAVQAFQKQNGLEPIGVIGPSTRAVLNKGK